MALLPIFDTPSGFQLGKTTEECPFQGPVFFDQPHVINNIFLGNFGRSRPSRPSRPQSSFGGSGSFGGHCGQCGVPGGSCHGVRDTRTPFCDPNNSFGFIQCDSSGRAIRQQCNGIPYDTTICNC